MTDYIFKKFTPLKKEVFDIVINEMLRVGWKQLNAGKDNENDVYMMYSDGNDGKKNIFIEFTPYDGRGAENFSSKSNYDVRETEFSDAFFKFCTGYNDATSRGNSSDYSFPVSWFKGRNYNSRLDRLGEGPQIDPLIPIELYVFIDKEKIIVCTIPPKSLNSHPGISYIGALADLMLEEEHEPYTRSLSWYASTYSGSDYNKVNGWTFERPKNSNWNGNPVSYKSKYLDISSSRNPNIDDCFVLVPFYILTDEYGLRGKLGGLFTTSTSGIVSGDILEIEVSDKIHKYKYVFAHGSYPSLPPGLAFRIE
ncbi:hypothetical protein BAMA_15690 [Bacillus manliponensis]|uniref:Uncharacterized protein n=1 Tax=Bacillus manliponensis TaxID=574376 RepID=A0A073JQG8_9BACI|nr:hypothetical protein [Bacillus manliponensis]KEK17329.1 hypothetical protein BAMA_15690 [Bacillus manliponensis]